MCLTNCECIEPLLAPFKRKRNGGSRPLPQRTVLAGILYKCRSGCQCPMLPACYGSKSTVHEHFQRWSKAGVMAEIFAYFSQSMERRLASMPNGKLWTAPCCTPRRALKKSATEGIGCNPTDRGRSGGKIHLHVDGQGIPLGVTATGANVHDSRLIGATLKNSREMGSWFLRADVRHLCLDKGYDYPRVSEEVYVNGFEEHIRSRGEEVQERRRHPAHRWVVERTFAWLKGFRSLRTRLLLLPRQFYWSALPCAGLYSLEKTSLASYMPDIL